MDTAFLRYKTADQTASVISCQTLPKWSPALVQYSNTTLGFGKEICFSIYDESEDKQPVLADGKSEPQNIMIDAIYLKANCVALSLWEQKEIWAAFLLHLREYA